MNDYSMGVDFVPHEDNDDAGDTLGSPELLISQSRFGFLLAEPEAWERTLPPDIINKYEEVVSGSPVVLQPMVDEVQRLLERYTTLVNVTYCKDCDCKHQYHGGNDAKDSATADEKDTIHHGVFIGKDTPSEEYVFDWAYDIEVHVKDVQEAMERLNDNVLDPEIFWSEDALQDALWKLTAKAMYISTADSPPFRAARGDMHKMHFWMRRVLVAFSDLCDEISTALKDSVYPDYATSKIVGKVTSSEEKEIHEEAEELEEVNSRASNWIPPSEHKVTEPRRLVFIGEIVNSLKPWEIRDIPVDSEDSAPDQATTLDDLKRAFNENGGAIPSEWDEFLDTFDDDEEDLESAMIANYQASELDDSEEEDSEFDDDEENSELDEGSFSVLRPDKSRLGGDEEDQTKSEKAKKRVTKTIEMPERLGDTRLKAQIQQLTITDKIDKPIHVKRVRENDDAMRPLKRGRT